MGLHNLQSHSLTELSDESLAGVEKAQAHGWIDNLLEAYSSLPQVPMGTQVEGLKHLLTGLRGFILQRAGKEYMRKAGKLLKVIEDNHEHRLAIYTEFVDEPGYDETVAKYTVWKGTLFEVLVDGERVVCWHPDKDFKPKSHSRILHTGYSELGRRRRRRETRDK
mgnify:CR=1 FL=1